MAKRSEPSSASSAPAAKRANLLPEDAFDCLICSEKMLGRIILCPLGHDICEDCFHNMPFTPLGRTCPSCMTPFPAHVGRNWRLEKLAETCRFSCRFGCGLEAETVELRRHQQVCSKRLINCRFGGCAHRCQLKDFVEHLTSDDHSDHLRVIRQADAVERCFSWTLDSASSYDFWSGEVFPDMLFIDEDDRVCLLTDIECDNGWMECVLFHISKPLHYRVGVVGDDGHAVAVSGRTVSWFGPEEPCPLWIHRGMIDWMGRAENGEYKLRMELQLLDKNREDAPGARDRGSGAAT